jgi:hypothetical protein
MSCLAVHGSICVVGLSQACDDQLFPEAIETRSGRKPHITFVVLLRKIPASSAKTEKKKQTFLGTLTLRFPEAV